MAAALRRGLAQGAAGDPLSAFGGIIAINRPLDARYRCRDRQDLHRVRDRTRARGGGPRGARLRQRSRVAGDRSRRTGACRSRRAARTCAACWRHARPGAGRPSRVGQPGRWQVVTRPQPTEAAVARPAVRLDGGQARPLERHRAGRDAAPIGVGAGSAASTRPSCAGARPRAGRQGPGAWSRRTPSSRSPTACRFCVDAGATAVIQPGGSMRDDEVIAAADAARIAMVFTGRRHFAH